MVKIWRLKEEIMHRASNILETEMFYWPDWETKIKKINLHWDLKITNEI